MAPLLCHPNLPLQSRQPPASATTLSGLVRGDRVLQSVPKSPEMLGELGKSFWEGGALGPGGAGRVCAALCSAKSSSAGRCPWCVCLGWDSEGPGCFPAGTLTQAALCAHHPSLLQPLVLPAGWDPALHSLRVARAGARALPEPFPSPSRRRCSPGHEAPALVHASSSPLSPVPIYWLLWDFSSRFCCVPRALSPAGLAGAMRLVPGVRQCHLG